MASVPASTWFSSAADWLQKPGSQNLLAGIGAKLDPNGIGAALGGATTAYNQSRVAEERAATQEKNLEEQRQSALKILQLSPPGQPGPTKIEAKKDGGIVQTSDIVAPTVPTTNAAAAPAPASATQVPGSGVLLPPAAATTAPAVDPYARNTPQFDIRQIIPFS